MASGPPFGGNGEKQKWSESKVYTRKLSSSSNNNNKGSNGNGNGNGGGGGSKKTLQHQQHQQLQVGSSSQAEDDNINMSQQQQQQMVTASTRFDGASDGNSGNGGLAWNRVKINLNFRSKQEMRELRRKLTAELGQVRSLVKKLEAKELQLTGYSDNGGGAGAGLKRMNSDVASMVGRHDPKPLHQLSIPVLERGGDHGGEKEKRTPKANQFYRNSDFLLAKDKFPPPDSGKKSKSFSGKKHGGSEGSYGVGIDRQAGQVFKSCSALLGKLMKHKHGWVFNTPVDVKKLGLLDYYTIIKTPMDLGTVKNRLNKNWYKSPREFAEDVRLTFRNAMTYNPKGQDVHIMADLLLNIFEERWAVMQTEYNLNSWFEGDIEFGVPTPTSKKTPIPPPFHEIRRTVDRPELTSVPDVSVPKTLHPIPSGRIPVPKKPKAKEPNKRDMTYEEKQRLSMNLQSLPPEKLDNIVQIIKKRNSSLCQRDDEIEVDIDVVDTETLWELDRFVTNYKKSLSKNKKKVEAPVQPRAEPEHYAQEMDLAPAAPAVVEAPKESQIAEDERNVSSSSPVQQQEKPGDQASRSSSSSSSSSDSGSSSSDSDSDSSSASDGGH